MLISNSHRFIFVHIPKTAGISLRHVLEPFGNGAERKGFRRLIANFPVQEDPAKVAFPLHVNARWARRKLPAAVFDGYLKFCVSRNPYDRAVSYVQFIKQKPHLRRYDQYRNASFSEALRMLGSRPRDTQYDMVADGRGGVLVDRVLRMETLDEDFAALAAELGLPPGLSLPRHNTSERGHYLQHFDDPADIRTVQEVFARDFEVFGYDLDPRRREAIRPARLTVDGTRA